MSNKILVTGCGGYIGSMLTSSVLQNSSETDEIIGVDNLSASGSAEAVRSLSAIASQLDKPFTFININTSETNDILSLVRSCDRIAWLSAVVGAPACDRCHGTAKEVNYDSLKRIVDKMSQEEKNNKTFFFPNTNSGYGKGGDAPLTEDSVMNPLSVYASTKCDAEKLILANFRSSYVFRLATVFGCSLRPRFDLLINDFTAKAFYNKHLAVYEGHARRNYIGINDVVSGIKRCFTKQARAGVYNFGNDHLNCTKIDLARRIAHVVGDVINDDVYVQECNGNDPDKRDYIISNHRAHMEHFMFTQNLEDTVPMLIQQLRTTGSTSGMRNY